MLNTGVNFFVQILDGSGRQTLYPAKVVDTCGISFTAVSTENALELYAGMKSLVFFEIDGEFTQQAIHLDLVMPNDLDSGFEICEDEDEPLSNEIVSVFNFHPVGDPVSAENRQCFRVSTVLHDVKAVIDGERDCEVQDVSAMGFSALATKRHKEGSYITVTLMFDDQRYSGKVRVQNAVEQAPGLIRYGFHGFEKSNGTGELGKGLLKICMDIQRRQLRRRTASA